MTKSHRSGLFTALCLVLANGGCGDSAKTATDSGTDAAHDSAIVTGAVVINEIQGDTGDFVEIINTGTETASLDGFMICDSHCAGEPAITDNALLFPPNFTLAPGEHFVIVFNVTSPVAGIVEDIDACLGASRCLQYAEGLSQTNGDTAILLNANSVAVDAVSWPVGGIGGGAALTLCRLPDGTGTFVNCNTTPGATNVAASGMDAGMDASTDDASMDASMSDGSVPAPMLVINEVDMNGGGPTAMPPASVDWFEIVNLGTSDAVLTGYKVCDSACAASSTPGVALPDGLTLAPGEHFLVMCAGGTPTTTITDGTSNPLACAGAARCAGYTSGLGAGAGGDSAMLFDPSGTLVSSVSWNGTSGNASSTAPATLCRNPDITGAFVNTCTRTPAAVNAVP